MQETELIYAQSIQRKLNVPGVTPFCCCRKGGGIFSTGCIHLFNVRSNAICIIIFVFRLFRIWSIIDFWEHKLTKTLSTLGHQSPTEVIEIQQRERLWRRPITYASHLKCFIKNIRSIKVKICIKDIFLCTMRKMQFEASNTLNVCLNVSSHWAHA